MGDALQQLRDWNAKIAIILGSGLNAIVQDPIESVDYAEFSEIPEPRVPGHAGKFSLCEISGTRVIFAQGRVHLYEGYSAGEVTVSVRMLSNVGIEKLVVTNAAGALNQKFKPGDWMMINDHLNLTGTAPLIGRPDFLDLRNAYAPRLQKEFGDGAQKIGMFLHQGVDAAVVGPQYETAAEVRMLENLGAHAVGMSTVLEVIQARALDMEVAGFSCVTNLATRLPPTTLSHGEVLETGRKAAKDFFRVLGEALPNL